jgi:hypothetical protein
LDVAKVQPCLECEVIGGEVCPIRHSWAAKHNFAQNGSLDVGLELRSGVRILFSETCYYLVYGYLVLECHSFWVE